MTKRRQGRVKCRNFAATARTVVLVISVHDVSANASTRPLDLSYFCLTWIWIWICTLQGPFLAIFAMELGERNANIILLKRKSKTELEPATIIVFLPQ